MRPIRVPFTISTNHGDMACVAGQRSLHGLACKRAGPQHNHILHHCCSSGSVISYPAQLLGATQLLGVSQLGGSAKYPRYAGSIRTMTHGLTRVQGSQCLPLSGRMTCLHEFSQSTELCLKGSLRDECILDDAGDRALAVRAAGKRQRHGLCLTLPVRS